MTRTCLACRARKMRCDGESPICGPCLRARKPVECAYSNTSTSQRRSALLQKGAACLPCRRKKKKCDAKRPYCNTCHTAGKEHECEYEEEIRQSITTALILRNRELEERLAQYESQDLRLAQFTGHDIDSAATFYVSPSWQPSPAFSMLPQQGAFPHASLSLVSSGSSSSSESDRSSSPGEQPTIENFIRSLLQSISPRPGGRSELICQNTFQLRCLFLKHQIQLGFHLRESKLNAIRNGDFSGRVVHPSVVHAAQLLGSLLWRAHTNTDVLVVDEEAEHSAILNSLNDPPDPVTLVIVYHLLAWYTLYLQRMEVGREYLIKAAHVIVSNNMQVTPPHMDGVLTLEEPDDDTKEHVTTIAHFIYSDNFAQMVLAYPPFLDAEYNRQLKLLSFMQPWLAKHSIVLMRCKSLVLLREAMQLSRMRAETTAATSSGGIIEHTALSSEWHTQYWETIEEVTSHVAVLYPQMLQTSLYSDPEHALSLKVCIIIALAAQVELHRMPGTYHMESRQKALSVVLEVIGLTKSLKDDDYAMLESVLGLCFTIIANAIRNDRELLVGISQSGSREREAFNVLINSTQQLATKLPFVDAALEVLRDIASGSTAGPQ